MNSDRFVWLRQYAPIALISAGILALTRPYLLGDTTTYAGQIFDAASGHTGPPYVPLWEFGHLIWRPTGLLLYRALGPILPDWPLPWLKIVAGLIALNLLCAWIAALLFYSIAVRLGLSRWYATALAAGVLCLNAFLDYAHSGHSYVPAVMFLALATRMVLGAASAGSRARAAGWAGLALGMSALLWFPYVLVFPAVVLLAAAWPAATPHTPAERWRVAASLSLGAAVMLLAGYAIAIFAQRLYSAAAIFAWLRDASHGILPSPSLSRTGFGIARSIVYMDDGIQFKRFLLHDPYANVRLPELLGASVGKLSLVCLFFVGLALALVRDAAGRVALAATLTAALPTLVFANFLFEPGQMERYLFLLPFLTVCLAMVLARPGTPFPLLAMMVVPLVAFTGWNLAAMWASTIHAKEEAVARRAGLLKPQWRPSSKVAVLNYQDELVAFVETFPFHPLNRDPLRVFDIIEPSSVRVPTWRQEFATEALAAWAESGDVWLTKRALAYQPRREWAWAEGVDPRVAWKELPEFFSRLEIAADVGGEDGFVRLAPSAANQEFLTGVGILRSHPAARFLHAASGPPAPAAR